MNETKIENFTPGPWELNYPSGTPDWQTFTIGDPLQPHAHVFVINDDLDLAESRAKIMAMAPDLYAENQRLKEVNAELVDFIRRLHDELEVEHITHTEQLHLTKRIGELIQKSTQP